MPPGGRDADRPPAWGHEREFVSRGEPYDGPHRPARGKEGREPAIREDALDEVLAQPRIVEPPFFLNWQQRKARDQGVGKQPAARLHGYAAGAVHLNALES